jgi:hypothetical protein
MKKIFVTLLAILFLLEKTISQPVPAVEENIPYLVTFGAQSLKSWGDDDYCQTFFFVIPKETKVPVYIRAYDPDCGGEIDEPKTEFNTKTKFSVYGGKGAVSDKDAIKTNPEGNFKSGNLLASKTFGSEATYNKKWHSFGPFNPTEGELSEAYGGYVFKMIVEGIVGDDGNLYKFYMSTENEDNKKVEGGNAFTFEYSFRLNDDPNQVSHIYPYIDSRVISVKQTNFDWDNDGVIRIVSKAKPGVVIECSKENEWKDSEHMIEEREKNSSLDIQFVKNKVTTVRNNNVVFYVRNQYGELLPFYTVPIGGIPKYEAKIMVKKKEQVAKK